MLTCTAPKPTWVGYKEGEATFTFGERLSANELYQRDKNALHPTCYQTWYWSESKKQWLLPRVCKKDPLNLNERGELIEVNLSPLGAISYVVSEKLDESKFYSLSALSQELAEEERYQFAFLRIFYPDEFIVDNSKHYVDREFAQVQKDVHYYFTNLAAVGMSSHSEASVQATKEIHQIVATALFSNSKDTVGYAIDLIKKRNSFFGKVNMADLALLVIPVSAAEQGLLKTVGSKIAQKSFRFESYLYSRIRISMPKITFGKISKVGDDFFNGVVNASKYINEGKFAEGITKIDLMGGKVSQLGGEFVNIDKMATKGINGDVTQLNKFIKPNSIDEIVCSNPQAEFLNECSKVMKPGGKIYINGTEKNTFFNTINADKANSLGFRIIEEMRPLNSRFSSLEFYFTDGIKKIYSTFQHTIFSLKHWILMDSINIGTG